MPRALLCTNDCGSEITIITTSWVRECVGQSSGKIIFDMLQKADRKWWRYAAAEATITKLLACHNAFTHGASATYALLNVLFQLAREESSASIRIDMFTWKNLAMRDPADCTAKAHELLATFDTLDGVCVVLPTDFMTPWVALATPEPSNKPPHHVGTAVCQIAREDDCLKVLCALSEATNDATWYFDRIDAMILTCTAYSENPTALTRIAPELPGVRWI